VSFNHIATRGLLRVIERAKAIEFSKQAILIFPINGWRSSLQKCRRQRQRGHILGLLG